MKKILHFLLVIITAISCTTKNNYKVPEQVIISGKILNFNPENPNVHLSVNRLGLGSLQIHEEIDSIGYFTASFESYTPTDVWVLYKTNFLVLTHPGDSIYVEFNGNPQQRPELLKSINFSGDAASQNQNAAKFQLMYFSNPMYYDWDAKAKAVKELGKDEYISYLDSLQNVRDKLYNQFVSDVNPNKETEIWAKTYLDEDYFDALAFYPAKHKRANKLTNKDWSVPISYYDNLKKRIPISESMFISGYALSNFINRFHYDYVRNNLWEDEENQKYKTNDGFIAGPGNVIDSLIVYGVIKHTPDSLLKQMVLTELIRQNFEKSDIRLFEKYRKVIESNIKESFLIEPLLEQYNIIKERLDNPQIASEAMLKKIADSSAKQIMDSIITTNKGKVIYLDCWATWCAPCISEMPNSKELRKKMEGKDVAFVYMCLDSEEKLWKASLAELQLTGQHYFLTKEQSTDIRKIFEVSGIPHYFLIDKKGIIIEKGSHLRPNNVEKKIVKLLKE
ncbi:Thiol-disulfide isomerase or thioredoxin [Tangfeifania diversioriginum]|uniref:Thiol-disulfide isomerase or thioredoxin n=1 Tax=Tangfeifania diversioriginum TaxID=1168035 RepID=A0A1M6B005_9BACT|nr:TlpA disulfide reductase family protein [Tangfeifania diversioriginum]SHI41898.1 Thiol-disulfide isomerase or thioredoxin [Tangfeifania diversioriginum]